MLVDLKRVAMSKKNKMTLVKSLAVDRRSGEFVVTTVPNFKKVEAVVRMPVAEVKVSGERPVPSKLDRTFYGEDCRCLGS